MIKCLTKRNLEERIFHLIILGYHSFLWGSQGRNSKQLIMSHPQSRAERNECEHSACLFSSISPFIKFMTHCLGNGSAHSGLGLPTSIKLIKTVPHRHASWSSQCRQSFLETSDCAKLKIKTHKYYFASNGCYSLIASIF